MLVKANAKLCIPNLINVITKIIKEIEILKEIHIILYHRTFLHFMHIRFDRIQHGSEPTLYLVNYIWIDKLWPYCL